MLDIAGHLDTDAPCGEGFALVVDAGGVTLWKIGKCLRGSLFEKKDLPLNRLKQTGP